MPCPRDLRIALTEEVIHPKGEGVGWCEAALGWTRCPGSLSSRASLRLGHTASLL